MTKMHQYYYLWANQSQYERERLGLCYQSKSDAEKSMLKTNEQELEGKVKPKKHRGKYTNYCFDKNTFLEEMKKKPKMQ